MGTFQTMQVFVAGRTFRHYAQCECGWHGGNRLTRASAVLDVGQHGAQTGHLPVSVPFMTREATPALALQAS